MAKTTARNDTPIFEFAGKIDLLSRIGVDGYDNDQKYVPHACLTQYWTDRRIREVIGDIGASVTSIKNEYLRILSTLACIDRVSCLDQFINYGLRDDLLPFSEKPGRWPSEKIYNELYEQFASNQWRFFPFVFHRNRLENYPLHPRQILPLRKTPITDIDDSEVSVVHKFELDEQYNLLSKDNSQRGNNTFVLKTYRGIASKRLYDNERQAFNVLKDQPSDHIVEFYGSFIQNETYNLVLEYVNGGHLLDFFKTVPPPTTSQDIRDFWSSYKGIFEGAHRIHHLTKHGEYADNYRIVHQDIKPENILLRRDPSTSRYVFQPKIADFGYSHVRFVKDNSDDKLGIDRQGGQMYSAPECCRNESYLHGPNNITAEADIFSFGCVTSDAAVWVAFGQQGRDDYRAERLKENEKLETFKGSAYEGCFHNGVEILSAVSKMHSEVCKKSLPYDNITASITQIAEQLMLVEKPESRKKARQIKEKFGHVLDGYPGLITMRSPTASDDASCFAQPTSFSKHESDGLRSESHESTLPATVDPFANSSPRLPPEKPMANQSTSSRSSRPTPTPIVPPSTPDSYRSGVERTSSKKRIRYSFKKSFTSIVDSLSPSHSYGPMKLQTPIDTPLGAPQLTIDQAREWRNKRKALAAADPYVDSKIEDLKSRLQGRDQLFFIDDSSTMATKSQDVLNAFETMSYIAKQIDSNALELVFASRPTEVIERSTTRPLIANLRNHQYSPSPQAFMELSMDQFMTSVLIPRLPNLVRGRVPGISAKPISILVFTDGCWGAGLEKAAGVQNPIERLMQKIEKRRIARTQVMFQFIRFGSDSDGQRYLNYLDTFGRERDLDIVDTKPWPDKDLWSIFIGSLSEGIDLKDEHSGDSSPG